MTTGPAAAQPERERVRSRCFRTTAAGPFSFAGFVSVGSEVSRVLYSRGCWWCTPPWWCDGNISGLSHATARWPADVRWQEHVWRVDADVERNTTGPRWADYSNGWGWAPRETWT